MRCPRKTIYSKPWATLLGRMTLEQPQSLREMCRRQLANKPVSMPQEIIPRGVRMEPRRSRSPTRSSLSSSRGGCIVSHLAKKEENEQEKQNVVDRWTVGSEDANLRQQWRKHGEKYNHICQVVLSNSPCLDAGTTSNGASSVTRFNIDKVFEHQPDDSTEFGIRCAVCSIAHQAGIIKKSVWTDYTYRGDRLKGVLQFQAETLRRHCNLSTSQRTGKQAICKQHEIALSYCKARHVAVGETQPNPTTAGAELDALRTVSPEQIRIAIEICHGWAGKSLKDYERRCASTNACPKMRSSKFTARRIMISASEVEFETDRKIIIPDAVEASWAQDGADGHLYIKYRGVSKKFGVVERMLDLVRAEGDRALQCEKDMRLSLDKLCSDVTRERVVPKSPCPVAGTPSGSTSEKVVPNSPCPVAGTPSDSAGSATGGKPRAIFQLTRVLCQKTKSHFQDICKNATADGAPNEQLALRFSKARNLLPYLDFITRAEEHNCALVLKNASASCGFLEPMNLR